MNVTVIDYKAGNLASVVKALRHLGAEVHVTENAVDLASSERIILPGVGHFAATSRLDETGMTRAVSTAIARGVPFLGICVGMQWLLQGSTEAPDQPGLGHFLGRCDRFPEGPEKVPHVGWNQIVPRVEARLFAGVEDHAFVYFTHSYRVPTTVDVRVEDGSLENPTAAVTSYIQPFAAAVEYENVFGVQFHPEKSGETGLKVLRNFLKIEREQVSSRTRERYVGPSALLNPLSSAPRALPWAGMTRAFGPLEQTGPIGAQHPMRDSFGRKQARPIRTQVQLRSIGRC